MLKELYTLTKFFCKFFVHIENWAIKGFYTALWEILIAMKLLVLEFKNFVACYITLELSQKDEIDSDIL